MRCAVLNVDDFKVEDIDRLSPVQCAEVETRLRALLLEHDLSPAEVNDPIGASLSEDRALIEEHNRLHPDEPITDADLAECAPDLLGPRQ